jgi:hypothetical protein
VGSSKGKIPCSLISFNSILYMYLFIGTPLSLCKECIPTSVGRIFGINMVIDKFEEDGLQISNLGDVAKEMI